MRNSAYVIEIEQAEKETGRTMLNARHKIATQITQIDQLTNNWNELEEWLLEYKVCMTNDERDYYEDGIKDCLDEVLDKMKKIKENNDGII